MTPERLLELMQRFGAARVAVVGDFFLDRYLDVDPQLAEPSLETGLTAHQVIAVRNSAGAAGTVVKNLAALGTGQLIACGAVGDDGNGLELRRDLERCGCRTDSLLAFPDLTTPTYLKPRDASRPGLAGEHSRYDTIRREPLPDGVEDGILDALQQIVSQVDAIIVLDQVDPPKQGVVTARVRDCLRTAAEQNPEVLFWVDSRARIREFQGLTWKVNQHEITRQAVHAQRELMPAEILAALESARAENSAPVYVTCGPQGIAISDPECGLVPAVQVDGPIDPTGAGDSVTAAIVLGLLAGASSREAALLGNLVASITIQQLDVTGTATPDQLVDRLSIWRDQQASDSF